MSWEVDAVLRALDPQAAATPAQTFPVVEATISGHHFIVFRTGVGIKNARRATRRLLDTFRCPIVVNTGCAGAISSGMECGDVLAANAIVGQKPTPGVWQTDPTLTATLASVADIRAGNFLSVRKPLLGRAEKQRAAIEHNAIAVEMEGAGVAEAASEAGARVASIRAVLDPIDAEIADGDGPTPADTSIVGIEDLQSRCDLAIEGYFRSLVQALTVGVIDLDLPGLRY